MREKMVTVIGLGQMGSALARTFLKHGWRTTVWNRSRSKVDALVMSGGTPAASVSEAVAASDLVVVCLLDDRTLHEILDPIGDELAGRAIVNLTTSLPEEARATASWASAHGAEYLAGAIMAIPPMIGQPNTLVFYSGSRAVFAAHEAALELLGGNRTFLAADPGIAASLVEVIKRPDRIAGKYAGKKAVIVGGTIGIGLATVKALLADGAEVVVTGRTEAHLAAARSELGPRARVVRSDLTSLSDVEALRAIVASEHGTIDFLFVNAGVAHLDRFGEVTEAIYDRTFDVNARGAFFVAQSLAPHIRDGGSIVFTTSIANDSGNPGMAVYAAAKAALRAFTKGIAAELLPRNIRVNAVSPGFITTPTGGITNASPEMLASFEKLGDERTPMGRHGTVEEVARAVLFLAFDATFTTGEELLVDGGLGQRLARPQSFVRGSVGR